VSEAIQRAKREAARAALELLPERGVIGLGTGSTAELFIEGVAELVAAGRDLTGVPTSEASRQQAAALGIPLLSDAGPWLIEMCVDGADEVSDALDLIKGGGGAHSREKIVNFAARTNVIVVDDSKLSRRLGEKWAVPVEVLRFGFKSTQRALERHGRVSLRERGGQPFVTDSGNFIVDVRTGEIASPRDLERQLHAVPGVVEVGLFVARADVVIVAGPSVVRQLRRSGSRPV
jgi:ribose 5-phosphate isomerase A